MADEFTYDVFLSHSSLESQTFRFRDPLNTERRFVPLRLDEAPIKGSLAQFLYINWRSEDPRRTSDNAKNPVKQIVFEGERFDVMSVRRWRDRASKQ